MFDYLDFFGLRLVVRKKSRVFATTVWTNALELGTVAVQAHTDAGPVPI
jgi:hypothetical protein